MFVVELAVLVLGLLATLGVVGAAVVVWLDTDGRLLAILMPVVGAAALVVVLHWLTLVIAMSTAPWIVLAASAASVGVAAWRRPSRVAALLRELVRLVPVFLVALAAVVLPLLPNLRGRTVQLVLASANHDAFYYLSVAKWLQDHPGAARPHMASGPATAPDAPFFGAASQTLEQPLRYGQELVQAWFSSLTGVQLGTGFAAWTACYAAVLVLAGTAFLYVTGVGIRWAVAGSLAAATAFAFLNQVAAQNADSLLGIPLAAALVACVRALYTRPQETLPLVALAALMLGGLAGAYSELLVFVAPIVVMLAVAGPIASLWRRVVVGAVVVAASLLLAAPAWWRAVKSAMFVGSAVQAASEQGGPWQDRLQPAWWPTSWPSEVGVAVAIVLVVVGLLALLLPSGLRSLGLGGTALAAITVYFLVRGSTYVADRAADFGGPLLVLCVSAGLLQLVLQARRRQAITGVVVTVVVGVVLAAWLTVNVDAQRRLVAGDWTDRTVSADHLAAGAWVRALGGDGDNVTVLLPSFFDELALTYQLSTMPDVDYPLLRGDLGYLGANYAQAYTDRPDRTPRYVLVGPGTAWSASRQAVVHRNRSFALLDLSKGGWAIATPAPPAPAWEYVAHRLPGRGSAVVYGRSPANLLLMASRDARQILVRFVGNLPDSSVQAAALSQPGWRLGRVQKRSVVVDLAKGHGDDAVLGLTQVAEAVGPARITVRATATADPLATAAQNTR